MTRHYVPPVNPEAEESVVSVLLISTEALREVSATLTAADFSVPALSVIYAAMLHLDSHGEPVDAVTVADRMRRDGTLDDVGGMGELHRLQNLGASIGLVGRYVDSVVHFSRLRRLGATFSGMIDAILAPGADPDDVLSRACVELSDDRILPRVDGLPDGVERVSEFMAEARAGNVASNAPWVIPGTLREGWRAVIVGEEGLAKSVLLRSMAAGVANGQHPFGFGHEIPALPVLSVDAENPDGVIVHQVDLIDGRVRRKLSDSTQWWQWRVPQGLDLTRRTDQAMFEKVVAEARPKLVTLGPVYKLYPVKVGDDWSTPTMEFLRFLDDIRTRYRFALVMEHHAPKGTAEGRKLFPAGASEWLRWPEFGLKLMRDRDAGFDEQGKALGLKVGRWRDDRIPANWPLRLRRSDGATPEFPWIASMPDRTFG